VSYELMHGGTAIRCRECGLVSYSPRDVSERYCGKCHKFHDDSPRRYGPMSADHPAIGELCSACRTPFEPGDFTTLVPTGPDNPEDEAKRLAGRAYNAAALHVHWDCRERV
jgi:hypothetical protein